VNKKSDFDRNRLGANILFVKHDRIKLDSEEEDIEFDNLPI